MIISRILVSWLENSTDELTARLLWTGQPGGCPVGISPCWSVVSTGRVGRRGTCTNDKMLGIYLRPRVSDCISSPLDIRVVNWVSPSRTYMDCPGFEFTNLETWIEKTARRFFQREKKSFRSIDLSAVGLQIITCLVRLRSFFFLFPK